jgi:hypothetical protein
MESLNREIVPEHQTLLPIPHQVLQCPWNCAADVVEAEVACVLMKG